MDNVNGYKMYDVVRDQDDLRIGYLIGVKNEDYFTAITFNENSVEEDCKTIATKKDTLFLIPGLEETLEVGAEFLLYDLGSPRMLVIEIINRSFIDRKRYKFLVKHEEFGL